MAIENYRAQFDEMITFHNERGRDDRFEYAKVRRGDTWYFLKHAPTDDLVDNLQREHQWCEFMDHVRALRPDVMLEGPKLVEVVNTDTFLFEWINAAHLADHNDLSSWQGYIKRYAEMLKVLDEYSEGWTPTTVQVTDLARAHSVEKRWQRWLGEKIDSVERLDEARLLIEEYDKSVVTQFQHGDLTPWQMFTKDDKWIIYDGEHAGADLARYNDLAYAYSRLATTLRSRQTAAQLLGEFLRVSGVNHESFFRQFLPVITCSAVGMISDAINDKGKIDYETEAKELLDICLERRLDAFLDA